MATFTLEVPTMYGDHHVVEVRRLLFELPGVRDVYASSSFHIVEVDYDETMLESESIEGKLHEAGYDGDLLMPEEVGAIASQQNGSKTFFRHSAAYVQTGKTIGFTQHVPFTGRPLWPCPGLGVIENMKE